MSKIYNNNNKKPRRLLKKTGNIIVLQLEQWKEKEAQKTIKNYYLL